MPLHIDYRPTTLDDLLGNHAIKESIKSVFSREFDKPHVILMTGPKGTGKTTIARIIASMVECSPESIIEYNCAQDNGIATVREITENAQYGPTTGKTKMYILDEAHCLTKGPQGAQNSLLKILEDTPKHVYFVLCTTDPEKLLPALVSRCMKWEVKSLPNPLITQLIKNTLDLEGLPNYPDSVIDLITKTAEGCPRQALILLDSVIDISDMQLALEAIAAATASETASIEVCRLLIDTRKNKWDDMKFLIKGLGEDHEKLRYAILGYMAAVLLSDTCRNPDHVSNVIDCFTESFMYSGKAGFYNACFNACKL